MTPRQAGAIHPVAARALELAVTKFNTGTARSGGRYHRRGYSKSVVAGLLGSASGDPSVTDRGCGSSCCRALRGGMRIMSVW